MKTSAILLSVLLTLPACSWLAKSSFAEGTRTSVERTASEKPKEDLPNFHEVHPFLYRGGEPTEAGLEKAKAMGIHTVIDLRGGDRRKEEEDMAKRLGMKYVNLPMSSKPPTDKQIATYMDAVKEAKEHPEHGAVYVHCAHGSDRTGAMVGLWRVTQDGWDYDTAYKEMRKYWFTPKFTELSGTVRKFATAAGHPASEPPASTTDKSAKSP